VPGGRRGISLVRPAQLVDPTGGQATAVVDRRASRWAASNRAVAGSSTVKFDIPHRVRAVYGRQLDIAVANGGYFYVALFYRRSMLIQ